MPLRALLFAAVSTGAQVGPERYSIPQQLAAAREVCQARGWVIVGEIAVEGHSRNYNWLDEIMADCPGYAELIRAIRERRTDLVVVRDYDRLWRTDALRAQVMAVCREHRVQVFSLNQPVEPIDPAQLGQAPDSHLILEALSGVISEAENRARTRRSIAGKLARVRELGRPTFSNAIPYGYKRDERGQIVVEPVEAEVVRWIFERRALDRWGLNRLARELNRRGILPPGARPGLPRPSRSGYWWARTVRIILDNDFYIGHVHWGEAHNENGQHEAIIPRALWDRARLVDALRQHWSERGAKRSGRVLVGLLRCGWCGASMTYWFRKGHWHLQCVGYSLKHQCRSQWMHAAPVEEFVLEVVERVLNDPEAHLQRLREAGKGNGYLQRLGEIDAALGELDARWKRWEHAYEIGAIGLDEMLMHRQRILGERRQLEEERERLEWDHRRLEAAREEIQTLAAQHYDLRSLPPEKLRQVYLRLIARIILRRGEPPYIEWL